MKDFLLWLGGVGLLIFLAGISFSFFFGPQTPQKNTVTVETDPVSPVTETPPDTSARVHPSASTDTADAAGSKPRVVIVIDDLGWDPRTAPLYDDLDVPVTMALLPERPRSDRFYQRWKHRFEFIIHMPMEPRGYPDDDPGEGALMTGMNRKQIHDHLQNVFEKYPMAVGMNNHMGSAFTADRKKMSHVMEFLSRSNLYYFDSGTSRESKALALAARWDVPAVKNQVFLDHRRERSFVESQLERLVDIAREHGSAIGIGHIQSRITAEVLSEQLPRLRKQGIQFVSLSEVVGLPRLHARARK